ncbi:conjugal transfer protein TraC [Herbaspirillum sp. HC18]|nr:conjugal transfer protein TraC [Herbaspirillum sp. HC18]
MFGASKGWAYAWIDSATSWADPMWWIVVSGLLFIVFTVHFVPLKLEEENHDTTAHIALWIRRICLVSFVGIALLFPLILYISFGALSRDTNVVAASLFKAWSLGMLKRYWTAPATGILGGLFLNFLWHRYAAPYLSNVGRKLRVRQGEDTRSDVREEAGKLQSKNFDPEQYFKDGFYFLGLDERDQPIYMEASVFEEIHSAFFAPTRFGKGVTAGVILAQSIRRGNTVIMVDPKGDKNLPYILQNEAKRAERPFVYLDLNLDGKGVWHPFKGGSLRDRRSRILSAFKLEQSGTDADVYKSRERGMVDDLLSKTDGSIRSMLEEVAHLTGGEDLSQLRDSLKEWAKVSTFTPPKKKDGHSIEKSLLNNAVVYVRGSLNDSVVKLATRCYIAELVQETIRLAPHRKHHLTMFVDEVRFVISPELVDALATIAGFDTNMLLATQSISDLLNIPDQTINGPALQSSFEINCQLKFIYKAGDTETAEWGEGLGGTKWIRVPKMEKLDVNRWGGEKWSDSRSMDKIEAPLISQNMLLNLGPRVAILYRPDSIAQPVFTCWINTDKSVCSWAKKESDEVPEEGPQTQAQSPTESRASSAHAQRGRSVDLANL